MAKRKLPTISPVGYAPGFFSGGYAVDPAVSGKGVKSGLGFMQDPGVPGMVAGDYSKIPTIDQYTQQAMAPGGYAAVPPVPGAGPGAGAGPAAKPNYLTELSGDPEYQRAMSTFNTGLQRGRSSLRDAIQQAVIQSGFDIRGKLTGELSNYASDLDDATMAAAKGNQLSTSALIQRQYDRSMNAMPYQLAAAGMRDSGSAGTRGSAILEEQQIGEQTGMNELMNAIRGNVGGYASLQNQLATSRDSAISSVADRLAQLQGPTYDETTTDTGAPAASDIWSSILPNGMPQTLNVGGGDAAARVNVGGQMLGRDQVVASLKQRGVNLAAWIRDNPNKARTVGLA